MLDPAQTFERAWPLNAVRVLRTLFLSHGHLIPLPPALNVVTHSPAFRLL